MVVGLGVTSRCYFTGFVGLKKAYFLHILLSDRYTRKPKDGYTWVQNVFLLYIPLKKTASSLQVDIMWGGGTGQYGELQKVLVLKFKIKFDNMSIIFCNIFYFLKEHIKKQK